MWHPGSGSRLGAVISHDRYSKLSFVCFWLLWLVRVITLVLVLRHSIENCSNVLAPTLMLLIFYLFLCVCVCVYVYIYISFYSLQFSVIEVIKFWFIKTIYRWTVICLKRELGCASFFFKPLLCVLISWSNTLPCVWYITSTNLSEIADRRWKLLLK